MYSICVIGIVIASICVILAVLVQSPKSGMAANFGAANQVMGVRETTSFLEKCTWTLAVIILVLSLIASASIKHGAIENNSDLQNDAKALQESIMETSAPAMPQADLSTDNTPVEEANN